MNKPAESSVHIQGLFIMYITIVSRLALFCLLLAPVIECTFSVYSFQPRQVMSNSYFKAYLK